MSFPHIFPVRCILTVTARTVWTWSSPPHTQWSMDRIPWSMAPILWSEVPILWNTGHILWKENIHRSFATLVLTNLCQDILVLILLLILVLNIIIFMIQFNVAI